MACFGPCVSPVLTQNEDIWNLSQLIAFEKRKTNLILGKLLAYHCVKYDSFFHSLWNEKKMTCFGLCVAPVLTQKEDIWNFHGSLTLNKGKLI